MLLVRVGALASQALVGGRSRAGGENSSHTWHAGSVVIVRGGVGILGVVKRLPTSPRLGVHKTLKLEVAENHPASPPLSTCGNPTSPP